MNSSASQNNKSKKKFESGKTQTLNINREELLKLIQSAQKPAVESGKVAEKKGPKRVIPVAGRNREESVDSSICEEESDSLDTVRIKKGEPKAEAAKPAPDEVAREVAKILAEAKKKAVKESELIVESAKLKAEKELEQARKRAEEAARNMPAIPAGNSPQHTAVSALSTLLSAVGLTWISVNLMTESNWKLSAVSLSALGCVILGAVIRKKQRK